MHVQEAKNRKATAVRPTPRPAARVSHAPVRNTFVRRTNRATDLRERTGHLPIPEAITVDQAARRDRAHQEVTVLTTEAIRQTVLLRAAAWEAQAEEVPPAATAEATEVIQAVQAVAVQAAQAVADVLAAADTDRKNSSITKIYATFASHR